MSETYNSAGIGLGAIIICDPGNGKCCVIEIGKIAEQGSHAELLWLGGHYHRLYTQQFRHQLETQYGLAEAVGAKEKEEAPEAMAAD